MFCPPAWTNTHFLGSWANQSSCHTNIEKVSNRPITNFYNGDDVNVIMAELGLTKMRAFYIII